MKIFLSTTAPSKNYKSWSNIPYLLHQNLIARGYEVTNIVSREIQPIKFIFNFPIRVMRKFFNHPTIYFYVRTPLHFFCTYLISKYIEIISEPDDVIVVQGFSYPPKNNKNRMILIGDWPSSYLFKKFLNRSPGIFEAASIKREDKVIESADAVITLFPDVYRYMKGYYQNRNIFYFGNVVNVDSSVSVSDDILEIKKDSIHLLFIGSPYYLDGARELITSVIKLRAIGYDLYVDIVGISSDIISDNYTWLKLHGYLDKGNLVQKNIYYSLLRNAKLYVNTTSGWNAYQATMEAMYFFTPIIVRKNESLVEMFPSLKTFSKIVDDENSLYDRLLWVLKNDVDYLTMCNAARSSVEPHTWGRFTDKLIELIEE